MRKYIVLISVVLVLIVGCGNTKTIDSKILKKTSQEDDLSDSLKMGTLNEDNFSNDSKSKNQIIHEESDNVTKDIT